MPSGRGWGVNPQRPAAPRSGVIKLPNQLFFNYSIYHDRDARVHPLGDLQYLHNLGCCSINNSATGFKERSRTLATTRLTRKRALSTRLKRVIGLSALKKAHATGYNSWPYWSTQHDWPVSFQMTCTQPFHCFNARAFGQNVNVKTEQEGSLDRCT